MVTNMISQLQESFTLKWATVSFQIVLLTRFCCYGIFLFFIRISTFWKRNYKYLLYNFISVFYKSFSTGILRSVTALIALLCSLENEPKKAVFYAEIFISIYKINISLHGRLGILILSSRAESISHLIASLTREKYFQHSEIKFVSLGGHIISSVYLAIPKHW